MTYLLAEFIAILCTGAIMLAACAEAYKRGLSSGITTQPVYTSVRERLGYEENQTMHVRRRTTRTLTRRRHMRLLSMRSVPGFYLAATDTRMVVTPCHPDNCTHSPFCYSELSSKGKP